MPGALEVLLSERDAVQDWARRTLDWPTTVEVWPYIGQQVGRRQDVYRRVYAAWRARAKPGRPRRPMDRRDDLPKVFLLQRRSEYANRVGKFASSLPGIPESADCFDLTSLQNLNDGCRVREGWLYDEETGELIGGWCRNFASPAVANRWYQRSRALVHTQFPLHRGKTRESVPGGWMSGAGLTVARSTGELRAFLSKPQHRREPDGLVARANCSASSRLVREFLSYVEAYDSTLSEELVAFHEKFPNEPPPMWITYNYQVR